MGRCILDDSQLCDRMHDELNTPCIKSPGTNMTEATVSVSGMSFIERKREGLGAPGKTLTRSGERNKKTQKVRFR